MAVQKNFVVRNGLEVNNNLLVADSSTDHVGVGTSSPKYTLEVIGGIGVTYVDVLGITTVAQEFNVGTGGTVITSLDVGLTGFGTQSPAYIVDIRSPVSTGQTALYVQGDVEITGDLYADDINLDQATFNNIEVTGVSTFAGVTTSQSTLFANNLSVAGFSTFLNTAAVQNIGANAVFTVGQNVDGTGEDHLGIYYDNVGGTPGVGGIGNIFTSNGDLRLDVVDGTSNIILGSQFSNDYLTVSGFDGTVTVAGLINADTGNIGFATITVFDSTVATITVFDSTDSLITTIESTNVNVAGIGSITTASINLGYVNTGIVTNLITSGIGSITIAAIRDGYINTGIVTNLVTTGIASIATGVVTDAYVTTGIVTNLVTSGIGSITTAAIDTGYVTTGIVTNLTTTGIGSITTAAIDTGYVTTGIVTNLTTTGIASIATGVITDAYVTTGIVTTLTGTTLDYSGIGTIATFSSTDATITTIDATNLTATGIVTAGSISIGSSQVISSGRELQNIASLDATTTATIEAAIANAPNTFQDIEVTGIATVNVGVFTSLYANTGIITTLSGTTLEFTGLSTVANFSITPIGSGATVGNSGIVTYYGDGSQLSNIISGVAIQSAGTLVGTGFTTLNFIGAGNTFAVNGTTIDISISGGGGGGGGGEDLDATLALGNVSSIGMSVGVLTATSLIKSGGTSSQFLKADGSVDSNTYLTSYTETDTLDSVTTRGSTTSNNISVGILTATSLIKSGGTSSQFLKADGSIDSNTYLTSYTETDTLNSVTTRGSTTSNNISVGILTATSLKKSGGTSSQFLKADGSVDSSSYITGIGINTEGGNVGYGATTLDFRGSGVSTSYFDGSVGIATVFFESGFSVTDDTSTDSTYYPVFVNATTGKPSQTSVSSINLQFNPLTGNLLATQFTSLSDITKKTNIRPIENPIEITKQLDGVRFDWINNNKPSLGLIAQEVEKVLPELVETNSEGIKSVSYSNMVGLLIEAIKEQQVRIEELERKLNA